MILTEEMVQAALAAREGVQSANVEYQVRVMLATVLDMVEAPVPMVTQADLAATMERRAAALEKAKEMTDALSTVPTNSRGYAADGAKAPSLTERMDAMLRLARFLTWETDQ
jgi:hypothetical protein